MDVTEIPEDDRIAACDKLQFLDWIKMEKYPYLMKFRFEEDCFTLVVSDFQDVYGEHLDEEIFMDRFMCLNPFSELTPNAILRHLKHAMENIVPNDPAQKKTVAYLTYEKKKFQLYYFDMVFYINGERTKFSIEAKVLPFNQFAIYVMKPILLKALTLENENAALRRKVKELEEGCCSSSSSGCSERKDIKSFYSARTQSELQKADISDAFLYMMKEKKIKKEVLDTADLLSTKGDHSASTSSSLYNKQNVPQTITTHIPYKEGISTEGDTSTSISFSQNGAQIIATYIPYEEGKPEESVKSHDVVVKVEDSEISTKIEQSKIDYSDTDYWDHSNYYLLPKRMKIKGVKNRVIPRREIDDEDIKPDINGLNNLITPKVEIVEEDTTPDTGGLNNPITPKREIVEEDTTPDIGGLNNPITPKREIVEEDTTPDIGGLNNPITPKREIVEEDTKEGSASKPPYLKPSRAKKQKYLRF